MANTNKDIFKPDYAVIPGDTLSDMLEHLGMSQAELARRTDRPLKTINQIIKGKAAITPQTALQFECVLGVSASFWNNLEKNYQEAYARLQETELLKEQSSLLDKIPLKEMIEYGWIRQHKDRINQVREALAFFGETDWNRLKHTVAFRKSKTTQSDPWVALAWLRKGEIEAQRIETKPYNNDQFKEALLEIKNMMREKICRDFCKKWENLFANCGVSVIFIPELPRLRVNGATRWLSKDKAVIQLSLLYKSDDQLWFTFFHEAGHILLHGKKEIFIETKGMPEEKEKEADQFSTNFLIPKKDYDYFVNTEEFNIITVSNFAKDMNIPPGIVVGRLQHDGHIPYKSILNRLKSRLEWEKCAK